MTQAPTNLDSNHMASTDENLFKVDFIRKEDDYKEKENLPDSSELIFIESSKNLKIIKIIEKHLIKILYTIINFI